MSMFEQILYLIIGGLALLGIPVFIKIFFFSGGDE